jgi:acyl-CoA synthetase (AMP-forming)/AMP-acid ligase II
MNTILTLLSHARLQQFYREGHWQDRTIYGYVSATAASAPDAYAVRDSLSRITYRELLAAADAFAAELTARGLRAGDRVAVWLPSRVEVVVALVACSRNGFVCCPSLHRDHTVSAIMELLERMRASAIVYQPGYGADADRHDFVAALAGLSSLHHCFELPPGAPLARETVGHSAGAPNDDPNRVVYLPFTSGTTGEPKGVMHSDNTLLANARALNADWQIGSSSVIYSLSPLSHNLGVGSTVMAFAAGAELVIHDLPRGASLVARLRETGATFLVGVPTHAFDFLKELRALPPQPLALKGFRISGAPASTEVVAGLLETSGRACRGYELRIFKQDDPETEADPGEMGQIAGRGASLMLGYFGAQETTERAFNASGWFLTGDVGWIDERGYVRVTGRKKDLIIRGGHNIYPAQIEALATRHDAVEKAVAIPVADERLGEKVCIAVVLRAGSDLDPEELLVHLDAEGLSKYEMPEYFLHLSELPLTASGKIRKMELVERVRDGSLVPVPVRWRASVS